METAIEIIFITLVYIGPAENFRDHTDKYLQRIKLHDLFLKASPKERIFLFFSKP